MSIEKKYLKTKSECKVTFTVPTDSAKKVMVSGDFNKWKEKDAIPLKKQKDGIFKGSINLPKDKSYEFKYFIDGKWVNDAHADGYKWNDFADAENSVMKL